MFEVFLFCVNANGNDGVTNVKKALLDELQVEGDIKLINWIINGKENEIYLDLVLYNYLQHYIIALLFYFFGLIEVFNLIYCETNIYSRNY